MPAIPTAADADTPEVRLVIAALHRPPLVWSPLTDGVTKCFTPYIIPKDPERPFGYAVRLPNGRWEERNGYEQELTRRSRFCDAAGGLIHQYRISHYSRHEDHPEADRCLLCNAPNPNHPDYDRTQDRVQCPVIRQHTMDAMPQSLLLPDAQPDGRPGHRRPASPARRVRYGLQ